MTLGSKVQLGKLRVDPSSRTGGKNDNRAEALAYLKAEFPAAAHHRSSLDEIPQAVPAQADLVRVAQNSMIFPFCESGWGVSFF